MPEPKPYALADQTIKILNRKAIQRFEEAKRYLLPEFDELNVIQTMADLYRGLTSDNRKQYKELFIARYLEVLAYAILTAVTLPSEDTIDQIAEMHLARLLTTPNPVVHYAYDAEALRKRDRLEESVNSVDGNGNKMAEMDKGLRYWSAQTGFYADFVADDANIQAMKDAGVQYVQWNTQKDEKVCLECQERNGKVYPIDDVPDKTHPRCRCWISPVTFGGKYRKPKN